MNQISTHNFLSDNSNYIHWAHLRKPVKVSYKGELIAESSYSFYKKQGDTKDGSFFISMPIKSVITPFLITGKEFVQHPELGKIKNLGYLRHRVWTEDMAYLSVEDGPFRSATPYVIFRSCTPDFEIK